MAPARWHLVIVGVVLAACTSAPAATRDDSSSSVAVSSSPPGRLAPAEAAALTRLAAASGPIDGSADVHDHTAVVLAGSLSPEDQAVFDQQVRAAVAAAKTFPTIDDAVAAGYVQSAAQAPGIGTHWVKWTLIDQPFDPARPAMLLFDQSPLHETRLAGFSYWVRSAEPPEGFAGPNDVWHRHSGLCFENGWLVRENVPTRDTCGGEWLNGNDLWMLHAWVAPGVPNSNGLFAPRNSALCPPDFAKVPDLVKCSAPGSPALAGTHGSSDSLVADSSAYCHLPT